MSHQRTASETTSITRQSLIAAVLLIFMVVLTWIVMRPGIYSESPFVFLHPRPGTTRIYYGRTKETPFFYTPDAMVLGLGSSYEIPDLLTISRIHIDIHTQTLTELPYIPWVHQRSTGLRDL